MRIWILITIIMMSCNYCLGQNVYYYTLSKILDYGNVSDECTGGQYVKVGKDVCYDVDADGNDVGNGKLYKDVSESAKGNIYVGNSYYGKSRYLFSADYSTLTVEINPHYKYIYKKTNAPTGVYTCSLIKEHNGSGDSQPINIYDNNYSQGGTGQSPNTNATGNSNSSSSTTQAARKFKCAYCNGTGRIERNDFAPASFGQKKANKKCNECGKIYDPTVFNHYHIQCGHCGGTGNAK